MLQTTLNNDNVQLSSGEKPASSRRPGEQLDDEEGGATGRGLAAGSDSTDALRGEYLPKCFNPDADSQDSGSSAHTASASSDWSKHA